MAKTALLVAAIKNCSSSGTAIQPGRDVRVGSASEKPYVEVASKKRALIQGRCLRRVRSRGKSAGICFFGSV